MTFLEICQRLRQEAGISGTGPTAVTGQSGEMLRVVDWAKSAYENIQNKYPHWEFLRFDFSFPTVAATATYAPTDAGVGLTEHTKWVRDSLRIYLTATGVNDEQWLTCIPWATFRDTRLFGANRSVSGRPTEFAVRPNQSIVLWPTPDAVYTVVGEYFKRPQVMSADADEPVFPREFHMAIAWRALVLYGGFESASEAYSRAVIEYNEIMAKLEIDQLPGISVGGTLV